MLSSHNDIIRFHNDIIVKIMLENQGDLYNHESLVAAVKSADVVISAVGYTQLPDHTHIISAIKEAGNVKVI